MAELTGTRIGPYEVIAPIGAGGMGQVYRAHDSRLHRDVALKLLPPAFAADPDRLARFRREAQVLAALNHPNIAAIYGLEETTTDGQVPQLALAMELVPGRTLDELVTAPIPLDDALRIARQIALALEAAHEQGIVHRDLKPANIKVTDDGTVKVLDFGLAKAQAPGAGSGADLANSPTETSPALTQMGVILGTARYMAPEQAKGKPVDRRADIWAFGVVVFELLSGRPLYRGETVTETIAHVITQPPDWTLLPAATPAAVRRLLRRCLEKDPRNRLQSAGDARLEIDEILSGVAAGEAPLAVVPAERNSWARLVPWAIAAVAMLVAFAALWPRPAQPLRTVRAEVRAGENQELVIDPDLDGPIAAISPDGRTITYLGATGNVRRLYARAIDQVDPVALAGTDGAVQHFFSPDSRSVGFFANGNLMQAPVSGGAPTVVTFAAASRGGAWGPNNVIVFTPGITSGLSRVSAAGGQASPVTTLKPNERTHRWPAFLPDGQHVLFVCQLNDAAYDDGTIELARVDTGERKVLVRGGTFPQYLPSGHLAYFRGSTMYAVPFDLSTLEVRGEPAVVLTGVMSAGGGVGAGPGNGAAQVSVSSDGTLVYVPAFAFSDPVNRLAIVDRAGRVTYEYEEQKVFRDPKFSPDGRRIATRIFDGKAEQLHLLDPARGTLTKVTFDGTYAGMPVWSADGEELFHASNLSTGALEVFRTRVDGTGGVKRLTTDGQTRIPTSLWPERGLLAISDLNPQTNFDLAVLSLSDGKLTPFLSTPAVELLGDFSPDGKWMAYMVVEADGTPGVFVRAFPDGSGLRQVSTSGGGAIPLWTKGGRELIYVDIRASESLVMSVDVTPDGNGLALGKPKELFKLSLAILINATMLDASADGMRFAVLLTQQQPGTTPVPQRTHARLVVNFLEEVRRLTGAR
jgi:hypothetical protein